MNTREQLVDWRAAAWAGLAAGLVHLGLLLGWLPGQLGVSVGDLVKLLASPLLGSEALGAADVDPSTTTWAAALAGHFAVSFAATAVIAIVLHRFGTAAGILGGAALGLCVYAIHIYGLALTVAPQLTFLEGAPFAITHVVFGACAGGVYELLEVERFKGAEPGEVAA